jgi:hypothetical protein
VLSSPPLPPQPIATNTIRAATLAVASTFNLPISTPFSGFGVVKGSIAIPESQARQIRPHKQL